MRTSTSLAEIPVPSKAEPKTKPTSDFSIVARLLPYLWRYKWRVLFALGCLIGAKVANVGVPILLKKIVDTFTGPASVGPVSLSGAIAVPIALVAAYGLARFSTSLFTELREFLFSRVTQSAVHDAALKTFTHLHALSLRFHLERRTGQVTREIDHGMRGIQSLVSYTLYSIAPTLVEVSLVLGYLLWHYELWFGGIVGVSITLYIILTVTMTNWRTQYRKRMVELDAKASARAVDSLLNFETVKYFNNEQFEAKRYDETLRAYSRSQQISQQSLNALNLGQQLLIGIGVTLILWRAAVGVSEGRMSLGDLVLVNAFMLQLYVPLNFLGVIYREIKQATTDMERMFRLLDEHKEIDDSPGALPLVLKGAQVRFDNVQFAYDPRRPILQGISFNVPAGETVAVVGQSGVGKSTLARLLFRFYDVSGGSISIDGQDIRNVTQLSLRRSIGIVPQDTVLFNDTIAYNIAYGKPEATHDEVVAAAKAAHIHEFISTLPDGYATTVGERGLKLSGGEKQRVAIARCLLKDPAILVFDEATSALDSRTEQAIQAELREIAQGKTTLVIAHRLSTIAHAHNILVLADGKVAEAGTHTELLAKNGRYAQMWAMQQVEKLS
jgi:ATP-binding cassette, subfamily B, heavy metal transporter